MKKIKTERSSHQLWAEFRFGVIGGLLSNPPEPGELQTRLRGLAKTEWQHPIEDRKWRISLPTIERWYYEATRHEKDPVGALRRKLRCDAGTTRHLTPEIKSRLQSNYREHPSWSAQLHCDDLGAWLKENPGLGAKPSYPTVRRYMRLKGFDRKPRVRSPYAPGFAKAQARLEEREVRSFELEHVGALFHLDIHHASRPIRTPHGEWVTPLALGVIDDHSRLCCHLQWYLNETAECLIHGFIQGIQKRGLPRSAYSDNGSAMISAEFTEGCARLGIIPERTLAYSPYQNGKQESFWGVLEGRLMAMLEKKKDLSLEELNAVTQAWVEMEYNRREHRETKQIPIDRFIQGKSVLRPSPTHAELVAAFRRDETRSQRRSDGTISILGKRFEIPSAYRTLPRITIRYAHWDLRRVDLVDPRTQACLAPLYPLDRRKNADGLRRRIAPVKPPGEPTPSENEAKGELPPLLRQLIADYAASGLPPAYVPGPVPATQSHENSKPDHESGETK